MDTSPKRLISLDAFRGFTIALMILVNNPGSWSYVIPPLRHAEWHGCTPTDLVFPFFLYIMGVAMAFSFAKRSQRASSRWPLYRQILKRTALLILIGWFLSLYPTFDFAHMRIPGVLPRIGFCYFMASVIVLHFKKSGQLIAMAAILLGYWGAMTLIPFAGKGDDVWVLGGNFAQYLDNILLKNHMWKPAFDPEGILSAFPAIVNTLLGYQTGEWLRSERSALEKTNGMFIAANILIVVALIWEFWVPINKQLWTSSYVLYTTGLGLHFLALSYWLIDVRGYKKGFYPCIVYGSNAIVAYAGSSFIAKNLSWWKFGAAATTIKGFIYDSILTPIFGNWIGSLVFPLLYVAFILWLVSILYKRKIFIKI